MKKFEEDAGFDRIVAPLFWNDHPDHPEFFFVPKENCCNPAGNIHGGILAFCADHLMGTHIWMAHKPEHGFVTIQLNSTFLAKVVKDSQILCKPIILRKTKSLVFCRSVFMQNDIPVFQADGIWKLLEV